jgi:hypothetical protein
LLARLVRVRVALAELARTDSHRFRVLVPDSDRTKALRAMTRRDPELLASQNLDRSDLETGFGRPHRR